MQNPITLIEAHQRRVDKINGEIEIGPNGTSLDLLQAVYRDPSIPLPTRLRAAMASLKHEHPSLGVSVVVNDLDIASRLDRAIERTNRMKLIEATPVTEVADGGNRATPADGGTANGGNGDQPEVKRPLPRIADRRFRRM